MITEYDTDTATIILPLTKDMNEYKYWDKLNSDLGAYVLVEVDYDTPNYIKLNFDYSLVEYDDLKYAKQEVDQIYDYVKKYWGITTKVNAKQWQAESKAYLEETA